MTKKPVVAILGATGAVGQEFIRLIEERNFPYSTLKLLASARSAGKKMTVNGQEYTIEEAKPESFDGVDIGLFAGGSISKELGPEAAKRGCVVIDNSSTFRMDPEVPLVVPEVNPEDISWHKNIIANPNCSTIIMLMALKPIHDLSPIKKIVVSTYQAVSGAGKEGLDELREETVDYLNGREMQPHILPSKSLPKHYPIAFNLIPQIDVFTENGYTKEEMKMYNETRKIMHSDVKVSATCVRVPALRAHSESIWVETERPISVEEAREAFANGEGLVLQDNPAEKEYPMPLFLAGKDPVYVGRIRKDLTNENGLTFWIVGDQIKKGAALNAVQIAEYLIKVKNI